MSGKGVLVMNGLQYIRKAHGMSLDTLGKRMGITRQTISQWEHGTCAIPGSRLAEMSQIFGVPEHLLGEITDENKQEIDVLLQSEKQESKEVFLFSQHEAALKRERNTISRIDYYLKGKGREFVEFEDLIAFIDGETAAFNRIMDIVYNDALRPVLYAVVRSFDIVASEDNRTNRLFLLKKNINELLDNAIENAQAYEYFKAAHDEDLY